MPGCAPSTPASHEPARDFTVPLARTSLVSSPKYQTLPCESCVPVEGVFERHAVLGDDVVHDHDGDAVDDLRVGGDGHRVLLRDAAFGAVVDEHGPGDEREVR